MALRGKGNTRPIRLADIAKAAGVSHGTASNVFSRPEIVREEVRERVKAAAEAMGYAGPDPKGRLLRAGKVNAIGVATSEPLAYFFDDPYARAMMASISTACDATGAGIALVSAGNEEKLAWNIQSALVDGFILFCIEGGSRLVELTRERKLPFVALELGFEDDTVSAIGVDNVAGARMAARHLAELGHRRFAVLSLQFADNSTGLVSPEQVEAAVYTGTRDRLAGYFEALSRFGVDIAKVPVYETENDEASTRAGLETIFAGSEKPTAILAMSDRMAIIAIEWLQAHGLTVPDDVSIVGFDGVPDAALCEPALTTVAQPIAEIGRRATRAILDFDGRVLRETLDVELVVRASSGPARA
ncbi:LacI family DNA-binding transcriptional regulator [Mesorhizobium sp. AR10]|uniref:LacI family DNA-binding transcriptional regulator n=1 Tax=Mesorhizobium sp. AR10 TaxID=2865839 RepID=UPI00215E5A6D|nr:LacI family DNA-binding transcriptional regulator [Mesorhizobium sp. AR10]UVK37362.1 LacI family DNA-binding transcriptional regulator [Mesorhizobium sp. AR10]